MCSVVFCVVVVVVIWLLEGSTFNQYFKTNGIILSLEFRGSKPPLILVACFTPTNLVPAWRQVEVASNFFEFFL